MSQTHHQLEEFCQHRKANFVYEKAIFCVVPLHNGLVRPHFEYALQACYLNSAVDDEALKGFRSRSVRRLGNAFP